MLYRAVEVILDSNAKLITQAVLLNADAIAVVRPDIDVVIAGDPNTYQTVAITLVDGQRHLQCLGCIENFLWATVGQVFARVVK